MSKMNYKNIWYLDTFFIKIGIQQTIVHDMHVLI